jgi:hypothetical protein
MSCLLEQCGHYEIAWKAKGAEIVSDTCGRSSVYFSEAAQVNENTVTVHHTHTLVAVSWHGLPQSCG